MQFKVHDDTFKCKAEGSYLTSKAYTKFRKQREELDVESLDMSLILNSTSCI